MTTNKSNLFQYCPKFVLFNAEFSQVLLCERVGEADFDKTYSFPGGKIENSDGGIWEGMQREKNEELGTLCSVKLFQDYCTFEYYVKNDGTHMILPHHICVFEGGDIVLSNEYSGYKRLPIDSLSRCGLKLIPTIIPSIQKLMKYTQRDILAMSSFRIL